MKKAGKLIGMLALTTALACTSPVVMAQTNDAGTTTGTTNDRDDDTGKWGLAGLLGLLGLLGLRRRDDDHRHTTANRT